MIKDVVAAPMEPFTPEEERALFDRLDLLSMSALEEYIAALRLIKNPLICWLREVGNVGLQGSKRPNTGLPSLSWRRTILLRSPA